MKHQGENYRFFCKSARLLSEDCPENSIHLTITSPPYWDSIDYDLHAAGDDETNYRERKYDKLGTTYDEWLNSMGEIFKEVHTSTIEGGFCAVVIGTILKDGKLYPAPFDFIKTMQSIGWNFHQDIIWNKVTGGVKRAGCFIQHSRSGYFYPNIMNEYILVFKKGTEVRRGAVSEILIDEVFTKDIANNIWHIAPIPPKSVGHPCPFPEEIVRRLMFLYSQPEDEILDPFLGSGQTTKVAYQHNRRVVGYDIELKYIDLSITRLSDPTKRKFHLIPTMRKIEADYTYNHEVNSIL